MASIWLYMDELPIEECYMPTLSKFLSWRILLYNFFSFPATCKISISWCRYDFRNDIMKILLSWWNMWEDEKSNSKKLYMASPNTPFPRPLYCSNHHISQCFRAQLGPILGLDTLFKFLSEIFSIDSMWCLHLIFQL